MENNNQNQTQEILEFLRDNVATKEDIKDMATKDDLAKLEIKLGSRMDNLESRMATKEDLIELEGKLKITMVSKAYLDDKLADLTSELGDRIYRKDEKDKAFKKEVIAIFQEHSLCHMEEIERLKELV